MHISRQQDIPIGIAFCACVYRVSMIKVLCSCAENTSLCHHSLFYYFKISYYYMYHHVVSHRYTGLTTTNTRDHDDIIFVDAQFFSVEKLSESERILVVLQPNSSLINCSV
jgi:hypothetical protein